MSTSLAKSARWYAEKYNWYIFPLRPQTKEPFEGLGVYAATNDSVQIERWWNRWPDANIGLHPGPSGLIVFDADSYKHNYEGEDFLTPAEKQTITSITGNNGEHLLYRMPDGEYFGNAKGDLPAGIDIKGYGGYIVLPPSIHPNGRKYMWEEGFGPQDIEARPLPPLLCEMLCRAGRTKGSVAEFTLRDLPRPPLEAWHLSGRIVELLYDGQNAPDRSEADQSAITALVARGATNDQILAVFQHYPIGQLGKFAEAGERYLAYSIGRARAYLQSSLAEPTSFPNGNHAPTASPRPEGPALRKAKGSMPEPEIGAPQVEPPLGADGHTAEPGPEPNFAYTAEDGGILDVWLERAASEWLYVTGYELWYRWQKTHWQQDETLAIQNQIQDLLNALNAQARRQLALARADGDKQRAEVAKTFVAATKRSRGRVFSIEGMAQARRALAASSLDAGNVLNLENGTLELDTLVFKEHDRAHTLTYCLPYRYDWNAGCPRFRQFIAEVLVKEDGKTPDAELGLLIQELAGYSLTNDTRHEVMVWLAGEGSNGKTVMIGVIRHLLGPLAVGVNFQTLGTAGNYDLADVAGKRVVFSTESERGGAMAESYIKNIASGEVLKARAIYGKPFEFRSTAKLWWAMNDMPTVRDTSNALWRRLKLVPFLRTFAEQEKDTELLAKLIDELSGILNWAIEGLQRLRQQGGFTQASAMRIAVEEYRQESNPVAQWCLERTQPGGETPATLAYQNYCGWCTQNGRNELNSTNFGRELGRLGKPKKRKTNGFVYEFTMPP